MHAIVHASAFSLLEWLHSACTERTEADRTRAARLPVIVSFDDSDVRVDTAVEFSVHGLFELVISRHHWPSSILVQAIEEDVLVSKYGSKPILGFWVTLGFGCQVISVRLLHHRMILPHVIIKFLQGFDFVLDLLKVVQKSQFFPFVGLQELALVCKAPSEALKVHRNTRGVTTTSHP